MNEDPNIVRHREILAAVKTLATLQALAALPPSAPRDEQVLLQAANAVEDLCLYFVENEKTRRDPPNLEIAPSLLWLLAASKRLGYYRGEAPGRADQAWYQRAVEWLNQQQASRDRQN